MENVKSSSENKPVAIYHVVKRNEGFEKSARIIFELVKDTARKSPDKERHLYLDIDGYLEGKHKYMEDMLELQKDFILDYLFKSNWLKEVSLPMFKVQNPNPQKNDIPDELIIKEEES